NISGTSASIFGLQAASTQRFTVAAADSAGMSPQSSAVTVTTASGSCSGGGGTRAFAPYMDISLGVGSQVATMAQQAALKAITLAFMVDNGSCTAVWGGLGGTTFPNGTTVARAISQLQANGVPAFLSFGGAHR